MVQLVYFFRNFGREHAPLYDGTHFVLNTFKSIKNTLQIMYYERSRHYQPILNLIGASGTSGYCTPCNRSYWRVEDRRCSNKCYKCMISPPCTVRTIEKDVHAVLEYFSMTTVSKTI